MTDPTPLRPPSRTSAEPVSAHRQIFIRDLVLPCAIGVHDHERGGTQRVRINVDLFERDDRRPLEDSIRNVVSYEDVVEGIREIVAAGHINLVETLAERIAALCLREARIERARVRVEKLDVYPEAMSVGVEIERDQA